MGLNATNYSMYGSYNISKRLKIEGYMNYNKQYSPNFPDVTYGPNSLIYNVAIWTGADWSVDDMKNYWQPGKVGVQSIFAEYQRYHNPYFMVYEWLRGHDKTDMYGYTSLNYKITDELSFTLRSQVTGYDLLRTEKMPFSAHPYGREQNLGDYREDRRNLFENNTEALFNYNYKIGILNLSGIAGGNVRTFNYNSSFTSTDYLNVPNVYSFSNSRNPLFSSSFNSEMRVISEYASIEASVGKFFTINATGRLDKSSALPPSSNSYFYPSISAASVLSDYIKIPKFISYAKARLSYAQVRGGQTPSQIGPSGTPSYLGYGASYNTPYNGPDYSLIQVYSISKPYNNQPATYTSSSISDPSINPFNRVNFEEGVDLKFLHNRLGISYTLFQYTDGPQILANAISTATGYSTEYINAIKTKKTGNELTIMATPVKMKNSLTWDILFNYGSFIDKYAELPTGQTVYQTYFKNGDRIDDFYGTAFARTKDGQIIHDAGGKPIGLPSGAQKKLGHLNPDFTWSIYNKVNYKSFTLGFQFDGSVGGVTTDYLHLKTMRGGRNLETAEGAYGAARYQDYLHATDTAYKGTYVGTGAVVTNGVAIKYDPTTGAILNYDQLTFGSNSKTVLVQDYISKYYGISEANLMSKTYAKLREIILTYNLPEAKLKHTFIKKASVSFVARNLLYFYKDEKFKDVDVEQFNYSTSATSLQTPTTRSYGLNINIVF